MLLLFYFLFFSDSPKLSQPEAELHSLVSTNAHVATSPNLSTHSTSRLSSWLSLSTTGAPV